MAHLAHGAMAGMLAHGDTLLSFFLFTQFLAYEVWEYIRKHDTGYLELKEWEIGFVIGLLAEELLH